MAKGLEMNMASLREGPKTAGRENTTIAPL